MSVSARGVAIVWGYTEKPQCSARNARHWRIRLRSQWRKGLRGSLLPRYARHHCGERFSTALTGAQTFQVRPRAARKDDLASTLKAAKGSAATAEKRVARHCLLGFPLGETRLAREEEKKKKKSTISCNFPCALSVLWRIRENNNDNDNNL